MICPSGKKTKRRRQQQNQLSQRDECRSIIRDCGHDGRCHEPLAGSFKQQLFLITFVVVVCYYGCSNITEAYLPPFVLTNQLASITTTSKTNKGKTHHDRSSSPSSSFLSSTKSPWTSVGENTLFSKNTNTFNPTNIIRNDQRIDENDTARTSSSSSSTTSADSSSNEVVVPFVIQQVERGMQGDYKEISAMCIDVFFREGTITSASSKDSRGDSSKNSNNPFGGFVPKFMTPLSTTSNGMRTNGITQQQQQQQSSGNSSNNNNKNPFLGMNLAFLRNAQYGDLTTRKFNHPKENVMFVAREVIPCPSSTINKNIHRTNIIPFPTMKKPNNNIKKNGNSSKLSSYGRRINLKDETVYNIRQLVESSSSSDSEQEYMTGDVIGFVEVTARPFALGAPYQDFTETGRVKKRPVLANLAVAQRARGSGVGSKLVQSCERVVSEEWNYSEILLQVEDNNGKAQTFYERRRYQVIFSDPASRTYDTSSFGLFPKQVRTTKLCMRKELLSRGRIMTTPEQFMKRIRDYTTDNNSKDSRDAPGSNRNGSSSSNNNTPSAGIGKVVFDLFKKNKD